MASNNLDLNNVPERMSVVIEKVESTEESRHRRQKEMLTLRLFALGAVAGILASLYVIVIDRNPEMARLAWPSLSGILCLLIGRATVRKS